MPRSILHAIRTRPACDHSSGVAFGSHATNLVRRDTNNASDVFVRDRSAGTTTRVSLRSDERQSNDGTGDLAISRHGGFVAFTSEATDLVPGDTNGLPDVFVRNLDQAARDE